MMRRKTNSKMSGGNRGRSQGNQSSGNINRSGNQNVNIGNAHQSLAKYLALAKEALSQGNKVEAESYFQHAEHYFRIIAERSQNAQNVAQQQRLQMQQQQQVQMQQHQQAQMQQHQTPMPPLEEQVSAPIVEQPTYQPQVQVPTQALSTVLAETNVQEASASASEEVKVPVKRVRRTVKQAAAESDTPVTKQETEADKD